MTGIMDHSAHYEEALPALDAYLSTEEKVILSDLSVNPSQIQQWAVLKINEYTNRVRSLKSVYNAGALVNRTLPREVLEEIFANLHHREEPRDVELRYLQVCRLWRHLIFRTPVFWVNMLSRQRSMYARIQTGIQATSDASNYTCGSAEPTLSFCRFITLIQDSCAHSSRIQPVYHHSR